MQFLVCRALTVIKKMVYTAGEQKIYKQQWICS